MNIPERIIRIAAYMRCIPEYKDYRVLIYRGSDPCNWGFSLRYTISIEYKNKKTRNEFVCYVDGAESHIDNVAIYGEGIRSIYNDIREKNKLWGLNVVECDWETDYVDVYFDTSDCWQDELPIPEEYHKTDLYTFELTADELEVELHNMVISDEDMVLNWNACCRFWDNQLAANKDLKDALTYPPSGIELSVHDYRYYKKHNYDLSRIQAWCMSGRAAHDYMRNWIPSPGFTSDAPKEEVRFSNELHNDAPRAGFYKVLRRETNCRDVDGKEQVFSSLYCYYTRSRTLDFIEEEVRIYEDPLYNKYSSRGPLCHRVDPGQILHVRRTTLNSYLFKNEICQAYCVEWNILYQNEIPQTYKGKMTHATNMDHPGIKAILSKLYFRAFDLIKTDNLNSSDAVEHEICFAGYNKTEQLIVPKKELEEQVFVYNEAQLATLCDYLSTIVLFNDEVKEIIDDLCLKSPIIAPYVARYRYTAQFSIEPPRFEKVVRHNSNYKYYFNIFDYSTSSNHCAYAELVIEGIPGSKFSVHYQRPATDVYFREILFIH